jgi:hypothetical protein
VVPIKGAFVEVIGCSNHLIRLALGVGALEGGYEMRKTSLALVVGAAILATASAYGQSVTPTEGNPGSARPAVPPTTGMRPTTTGAAPNSAVPNQVGSPHMPGGNPDRAPASTQTHEPPAK